MKVYALKSPPLATSVPVFIGIDVAMNDMAVCVLSAELNILTREKIAHSEEAVAGLLRRLPDCKVSIAYEAGPTGYTLLRWLRQLGCKAVMVAPSRIPVASGDRVKTDKRDALKLATLLARGQLEDLQVQDLTDEQYADRQLVRCRAQAVQRKSRICLQIKSLMLMHHVVLPEHIKPKWSKAMRKWLLEAQTGRSSLDEALHEQVSWLEETHAAVRRMDMACLKLSQAERLQAAIKLLRSVPGFGVITALVLATELPDLCKRFADGRALARYAGLVPTEYSTGKSQERRGHLTHDGNAWIRTTLVEASWRLIRHDPAIHERYQQLKSRVGSRKAIVSVARHLAMIIFAMFRDGQPYRTCKEAVTLAA